MLPIAKETLWKKAQVWSHGERYLKTPKDEGYEADDVNEIDLASNEKRIWVKAFYGEGRARTAYHLEIEESEYPLWAGVIIANKQPVLKASLLDNSDKMEWKK